MSLREYDLVWDRIKLHRRSRVGTVLIVEGGDDVEVLQPHLNGVDMFPAGGRPTVVRTAEELNRQNDTDFLCVVDQDFMGVTCSGAVAARMMTYDGADLEAMLIDLGVLHRVARHYASQPRGRVGGRVEAAIEAARQGARLVGNLRSFAVRNGLAIRFSEVDLGAFVDRATLELDLAALSHALISKSNVPVSVRDLHAAAQLDCGMYSGKDLLSILGVAFRRVLSTRPAAQCTIDVLLPMLHSGAEARLGSSPWMQRLQRRTCSGAAS